MANRMMFFLRTMRLSHGIKNLFIFAPLIFGLRAINLTLWLQTFYAFVAFSLIASGVYVFNDCLDKSSDKKHPVKKKRPIASGAISMRGALLFAGMLELIGLGISTYLPSPVMCLVLVYLFLNFFYSIKLKHIALIDVTIIAVGFVLRLYVGSAVTNVGLSPWILIMTYLLALFLGFAKRRDDVLLYNQKGVAARKVIHGYNLVFLNAVLGVLSAIVIVAYCMYCIDTRAIHAGGILGTAIFVILGMLRYLQITFVEEKSGDPTLVVLKDHFMLGALLGWFFTFTYLLYGASM